MYKYACLLYPPGPGNMPRRGLIKTKLEHFTTHLGNFAWGWVIYDRKLNEEEVEEYGFEEIPDDDQ